jgi:hypothetical protein
MIDTLILEKSDWNTDPIHDPGIMPTERLEARGT